MNLLFVAMIGSSFLALKMVGVGMVTVWKNLSNFTTAMGGETGWGEIAMHGWQPWDYAWGADQGRSQDISMLAEAACTGHGGCSKPWNVNPISKHGAPILPLLQTCSSSRKATHGRCGALCSSCLHQPWWAHPRTCASHGRATHGR